MDTRLEGEDTITKLYEASMEGCALTFNTLIQKDPLILSKISVTTFNETPLHISSLLGHLNFTKQLLTHKPKLASELDSHNRSPLHLASAEGHAEIVQALLQENEDMCLAKDEDGRIPLHYAAMRGRVDVIRLLIRAQWRSVFETTPMRETVLHLCVQYNHLEALKVLVESVGYENSEFLNLNEKAHGNTILHLAVMLKQIETVKYLMSLPEVRSGAETIVNHKGLKVCELLVDDNGHFPRDFKSLKIQCFLMDADLKTSKIQKYHQYCSESTNNQVLASEEKNKKSGFFLKRWWRKLKKSLKYKGDWIDDKRGSIMVVATVIGTVTFTTAVSPPGGVWGENTTDSGGGAFSCSEKDPCLSGTSVMARLADPAAYLFFVAFNTISFLASMSAILLLVSGFPIKNKICMGLLTVAMCAAVSFMTFAFLIGMRMVTPLLEGDFVGTYRVALLSWIGVLLFVCLLQTIRFLVWMVRKLFCCCCRGKKKKKKQQPIETKNFKPQCISN